MKKILFDLEATQPNSGKYHGGGEYSKIIFKKLLMNKDNIHLECFYNSDKELSGELKESLMLEDIKLLDVNRFKGVQEILDKNKYDKFFSGLPYNYYNLKSCGSKFIFTIHGLRPIECPTDIYEYKFNNDLIDDIKFLLKHLFYNKYVKKRISDYNRIVTKKNTTIIVPSLYTKYSIINLLNINDASQIIVSYSPDITNTNKLELDNYIRQHDKLDVKNGKYILMVSGGRWIKNTYRGIKALDQLFEKSELNNYDVVITGVDSKSEFNRLTSAIKNKTRFKFIGYVDKPYLQYLYKNSFMLLYPSLNEGFGYPPLESFQYGKPVICSANTSLLEVCGDAALYCDPLSIDDIKNKILMLFNEEKLYSEKSKRAFKRYSEMKYMQDEMLKQLIDFIVS